MADPQTIGEANIALDGFKFLVSDQIAELRRYLYWVLGLLVIVLGAGIAIYRLVGEVQVEAQKQGGELRIEILKQGGDLRAELQKQIGDLRLEQQKQISDVKTDIALGTQAIGRIEKTVGDLQTNQGQALARIETLLQTRSNSSERLPSAAMLLDENEKQLIFKFILVKSVPGAKPSSVKVGDLIPDPTLLKPIPDDLAAAVPKLRGARFSIDENSGSILLVGAGDNHVVAIVERT
jgi:hypothetical protein